MTTTTPTSESPSAPAPEAGDYSVSIAQPQGSKICTWRLAPQNNGIAIGLAVDLNHTGSQVTTARVPVTLTIVEADRSTNYTFPVDNSETTKDDLEVPGFAPGTAAYTVHLTVTISPPGPDLIPDDNTATATVNVPVGTPTTTAWKTIPCT